MLQNQVLMEVYYKKKLIEVETIDCVIMYPALNVEIIHFINKVQFVYLHISRFFPRTPHTLYPFSFQMKKSKKIKPQIIFLITIHVSMMWKRKKRQKGFMETNEYNQAYVYSKPMITYHV